jgi:HEAT repeat protein
MGARLELNRWIQITTLVNALLMTGASQGFAQAPGALIAEKATIAPDSPQKASQKPLQPAAPVAPSLECCKSKSLPAAAWDTLAEDIRSDRESHRSAALAALAVIGRRDDTLPLLESALEDKHPSIRKNAALALGDLQARSSAVKLRNMLDDPSPEVSFAAASALWKMQDHSGRDVLITTLSGQRKGDGVVKSGMKNTYQRYRDPKQLAVMGAREAAGTFLGPASMGVGVAQELMKDHSAPARAASADLLSKDPTPDAIHELTLALTDKNWAVRAAAAQALAKSPGQVSPEVFEPLLIDDNMAVRDTAAAGIIRITRASRPKDLQWPAAPASSRTTEQAAQR